MWGGEERNVDEEEEDDNNRPQQNIGWWNRVSVTMNMQHMSSRTTAAGSHFDEI